MTPIITTVSISYLRTNIYNMMDKIQTHHRRFIITNHGKARAVLMSIEELESIEETVEILGIPGALERITKGTIEAKAGKGIPLEKVLKNI